LVLLGSISEKNAAAAGLPGRQGASSAALRRLAIAAAGPKDFTEIFVFALDMLDF
jgi:hypothetical protein